MKSQHRGDGSPHIVQESLVFKRYQNAIQQRFPRPYRLKDWEEGCDTLSPVVAPPHTDASSATPGAALQDPSFNDETRATPGDFHERSHLNRAKDDGRGLRRGRKQFVDWDGRSGSNGLELSKSLSPDHSPAHRNRAVVDPKSLLLNDGSAPVPRIMHREAAAKSTRAADGDVRRPKSARAATSTAETGSVHSRNRRPQTPENDPEKCVNASEKTSNLPHDPPGPHGQTAAARSFQELPKGSDQCESTVSRHQGNNALTKVVPVQSVQDPEVAQASQESVRRAASNTPLDENHGGPLLTYVLGLEELVRQLQHQLNTATSLLREALHTPGDEECEPHPNQHRLMSSAATLIQQMAVLPAVLLQHSAPLPAMVQWQDGSEGIGVGDRYAMWNGQAGATNGAGLAGLGSNPSQAACSSSNGVVAEGWDRHRQRVHEEEGAFAPGAEAEAAERDLGRPPSDRRADGPPWGPGPLDAGVSGVCLAAAWQHGTGSDTDAGPAPQERGLALEAQSTAAGEDGGPALRQMRMMDSFIAALVANNESLSRDREDLVQGQAALRAECARLLEELQATKSDHGRLTRDAEDLRRELYCAQVAPLLHCSL